jgi:hypothetical protein
MTGAAGSTNVFGWDGGGVTKAVLVTEVPFPAYPIPAAAADPMGTAGAGAAAGALVPTATPIATTNPSRSAAPTPAPTPMANFLRVSEPSVHALRFVSHA